MSRELEIIETQWPDFWKSDLVYAGYDRESGLHRFRNEEGKIELYAKRKHSPAGWHLLRGSYAYEFCRSA